MWCSFLVTLLVLNVIWLAWLLAPTAVQPTGYTTEFVIWPLGLTLVCFVVAAAHGFYTMYRIRKDILGNVNWLAALLTTYPANTDKGAVLLESLKSVLYSLGELSGDAFISTAKLLNNLNRFQHNTVDDLLDRSEKLGLNLAGIGATPRSQLDKASEDLLKKYRYHVKFNVAGASTPEELEFHSDSLYDAVGAVDHYIKDGKVDMTRFASHGRVA